MKKGSKPYLAKPYNILLLQRPQFKDELDRQCSIGIITKMSLKEFKASEWGFLLFGIPKKNKKKIRTVGDF